MVCQVCCPRNVRCGVRPRMHCHDDFFLWDDNSTPVVFRDFRLTVFGGAKETESGIEKEAILEEFCTRLDLSAHHQPDPETVTAKHMEKSISTHDGENEATGTDFAFPGDVVSATFQNACHFSRRAWASALTSFHRARATTRLAGEAAHGTGQFAPASRFVGRSTNEAPPSMLVLMRRVPKLGHLLFQSCRHGIQGASFFVQFMAEACSVGGAAARIVEGGSNCG
eukprot:Polyplicarium_translucidae@DN820_c0_g1_i1.p1